MKTVTLPVQECVYGHIITNPELTNDITQEMQEY